MVLNTRYNLVVQGQRNTIYVVRVSESQISVRFALRPVILELQTILRQVHTMTSK